MTREDAIKILRANVMVACDTSDKVGYDTPLNKAIEQALEMAIKALEQDTVPREHYEHEYFLRKELDFKVARLEKQIAEQEPCEDAVSRQAVLEYIEGSDAELGHSSENKLVCQDIKEFPSVTPTKCIATVKFSKEDMQELVNEKIKEIVVERKKGKWIGHGEHCENLGLIPNGLGAYEWCSNCDCGIDVREWHRRHYNYCPNCGAEMESEE